MSTQLIKDTVEHQKELSQAVLNYGPRIIVDIYCRVSTEDQEDNTSLDSQEQECRQFCKEHGLIVGLVHKEVFSGFYYREREKMSLMRERYLSKKIRGVIVRTYDRLSRKEVHFGILLEEMEHNGIVLHCVKEQLEDTIIGRLTRMFLGFLAEWEWEKIRDRTTTGRINKAKEGKISVAGYKLPYWLQWHDPNEKDFPILHPERAAILEEVAKKYDKGVSLQAILRDLTERKIPTPLQITIEAGRKPREGDKMQWCARTLMKMLEDPRIAGKEAAIFHTHAKDAKIQLEPVLIPAGVYPAVISEELYERIIERAKTNKLEASKHNAHPENYLLRAGFIKCKCGRAMVGAKAQKGHPESYKCANPACPMRMDREHIDRIIWEWAEKLADHTDLIEEAIKLATGDKKMSSEAKSIEASLGKWRMKAENYTEDLNDESLRGDTRASIRQLLNAANEMIEQLEIEHNQVTLGMIDKEKEKAAYQEILTWCRQVKEAREELSYQRKRDFFRMLGLNVIMLGREKWRGEMKYKIEITLPEIQELIPKNPDFVRPICNTGQRDASCTILPRPMG